MSGINRNSILKLIICLNFMLILLTVNCEESFIMKNDYQDVVDVMEDRISREPSKIVECGGVFKNVQTELFSPNYPDNYGDNMYCEFVFKSPYMCRMKYHIQFLDFALEPSRNCSKDRVEVGDSDILCGTVIGIKMYETKSGMLTVKFKSDNWKNDRGFKLLVTRQPCEDNDEEHTTDYPSYMTTIPVYAEMTTVKNLTDKRIMVNNRQDIPPDFNGSGYLPPPTTCFPHCIFSLNCIPNHPWGLNPTFPNSPRYPGGFGGYPSFPNNPGNYPNDPNSPGNYPNYPNSPGNYPNNPNSPGNYPNTPGSYPETYPSYPNSPGNYPNYPKNPGNYPNYPNTPGNYPEYYPGPQNPGPTYLPPTNSIGGIPNQPGAIDTSVIVTERPQHQIIPPPGIPLQCCRNAFNQRRFYLVSQGFPSRYTNQRDCLFQIQRFSPYSCRLRIDFKFFLFGDERLGCLDNFIEIDGQRICGCKTGLTYTAQWGIAPKTVRIRSVAAQYQRVQGFVLDVIQEDCPFRYSRETPAQNRISDAVPKFSTVQTNLTSLATHYYYFYDTDSKAKSSKAAPNFKEQQVKQVEIPSSQVFFPNYVNNAYGRSCDFTSLQWLKLKFESLWISKPRCYPPY